MEPRTISFAGRQVTVPFIGGRRLVRLSHALRELSETVTIEWEGCRQPLGKAMLNLPLSSYPTLILLAYQTLLDQCVGDEGLTTAERLFYGTIGDLIGMSADEVADAALDDLSLLVRTIYEQERETQSGKWLIRTFERYGAPTTTSESSDAESASPSDTTIPPESEPTMATTGAA